MTTKLFGERVQRVEDAKLVTGQAHYLDDLGHDAPRMISTGWTRVALRAGK